MSTATDLDWWYAFGRCVMATECTAFIFFCRGDNSPVPVWVRRMTGSPYAHVGLGCDEVVLDPGITGNRLWTMTNYIYRFPTLALVYICELDRRPDLESVTEDERKAKWPTWVRWMTCGWFPSRDCVAITTDLIRRAGRPVPRRIVSPHQLLRWCQSERMPHASIPWYRKAYPVGQDSDTNSGSDYSNSREKVPSSGHK